MVMEDFYSIVFGTMSFWTILGYIALMLAGAGVSTFLEVKNRDVTSLVTPKAFSLKFFFLDNVKRFIGVILAIFLVVRFSDMLFPGEPIDWVMVSIGYNIDSIIAANKKGNSFLEMKRGMILKKGNDAQ